MKNQQRETRDLYQQVTDQIIAVLESGTMPWIRPWKDANPDDMNFTLPCNAESHRPYSGINVLLLWMSQYHNGFKHPQWLTFNGVKNLGGTIRKGEKSTQIILYRPMETEEKDTDGNVIYLEGGEPKMRQYAIIRGIPVFNIEQCDGLTLPAELVLPEKTPVFSEGDRPDIEGLPQNMGVGLYYRPQNRACYSPAKDFIVMPEVNQFEYTDLRYATLLHECAHATGHSSRLARPGVNGKTSHGDPVYAFEELIAELTSAFMCAHIGIDNISQNAAYLEHWISALKADKRAIFRATSEARKATDYLLDALHQYQPALQKAS